MREKINFDKDWLFHKGDLKEGFPSISGYAYRSAKTQRKIMGPANPLYQPTTAKGTTTKPYSDVIWRNVNLPHDYVIEGVPEEQYNENRGFLPYDNAWYRKSFTVEEEDRSKRITLYFEGVATHATVYLNGCLMKHSFTGYTPFEVDITDMVKFGEENVLAVYVNTEENEGWWYEGGGIYRHVWMIKTDRVAVDLWGVFAKPVHKGGNEWVVKTEVTVRNDDVIPHTAKAVGTVLDTEGNVIGTAEGAVEILEKDQSVITYSIPVSDPRRWSPEDAYQYTMNTKIYNGGEETDETDVKFGFRTFRADAKKGFFINDKPYKIKGMCGHADCGLMGKAVPDNIHRYKVQMMKEMGVNGYRCSHYPQAEALMDAFDENGFIVMDEVRWYESTEEGRAQMEALLKRDRNRPSVFFWSLGNEEFYHKYEPGRRICKSMMAWARRLDDSRLIMSAVNYPYDATIYDLNDVIGINYQWKHYNTVHESHPDKPLMSSECCATGTTRGWYFPDCPEQGYISAYDHDTNADFRGREFTWKYLAQTDWIMGGYQWDAFEHRGEAKWPRLCSQSGAIDLFMQPKDAFYQNKSHFTEAPMVHLLPHWNFKGMEGEPITVFAYTNAEELELFLNGESLGRKQIEKYGHGEWTVKYVPGTLEVIAYKDGTEVARDKKITSGKAAKLILTQNTFDISANGQDIALVTCSVQDENGTPVPDATVTVSFSTGGDCKVYSTGSDISEHDTIFKNVRRMRAGTITVAVKLGENPEGLRLIATSDGLDSALLYLNVQE